MTIHNAAKKGFEAGADAYERGRPGYPKEAVNRLCAELALTSGKTVIDLGAGTGKFTKLLSESTQAEVIAVEPVAGMLKKFTEMNPTLKIVNGSAENIPMPSSSVDVVVAAQAFHWFDGEKTLREISRVLKPGGQIGLIWNARDESFGWVRKLTEIIDPYEQGAPRYKSGKWRTAFVETLLFSEMQSTQYCYFHEGTQQMVVDRIGSISFIAALADEAKSQVLSQVRDLLTSDPETQGRNEIAFPYRTDIFWCRKLSSVS